ncbi:aryl-sulfate sulfotransferase [Clostridium sp. MSJ-8]|nr:aryl-sulfate sulfotransferase [Clostridium sp. MSJ-8]
MFIVSNPYGTNTLSLYVYFKTDVAAMISYKVSVEDEDIADFEAIPTGEDTATNEHEFQVIGLVPNCTNKVTFTIKYKDGSKKISTYNYNPGSTLGDEETKLSVTEVQKNCEEELSDGLYVILGNDSDDLDFMYYYDNNGVLRGEIPIIGYRSHRILFQDNMMYYSISTTKIAAVDGLGKVQKVYDTGKYKLHHDYSFDDDGNIVVLATDTESDTVEDRIIRIDKDTEEIIDVFDLAEVFGEYKEKFTDSDTDDLDWMHINTLQWIGNETVILSSRETSSIIKISNLFTEPKIDYIIGEENFWNTTGYEELVLKKDESKGDFSGTGGQHTVTYEESDELSENQYYLYMFDNNLGISESRSYDWTQIEGIATSITEDSNSYYYKYLVDENKKTYTLVESFSVPFSPYVSSAQEYEGNIIIDSGMQGIFGEYDNNGNLLRQYSMKLSDRFIYRVYKYDFKGILFS